MKINKKTSSFLKALLWLVLYIGLIFSVLNNNLAGTAFIAFILIGYYIDGIEKKLNKQEKPHTENSVVKFTVNPHAAIVRNKRFGELFGLKTNTEEFNEWSKSDQEKLWGKGGIREKLKDKLFGASFTYLPNENAYFVRDNSNYTNIIKRKFGKTCIYSEPVTGNRERPRLDLEIYERIPHFRENKPLKYEEEELKFLTVCLKYYAEGDGLSSKEDEFTILCELPLGFLIDRDLLGEEKWKEQCKKAVEYIKKEGFEEKEDNNEPWGWKDDFEEEPIYYSFTVYRKNGVEITFSH